MSQLEVTGTLTPDATGTYSPAGTYDGATYYARVPDGDYVIYWNSYAEAWHISDTLSPWPDIVWLGDSEVLGEYPAAGSYTSGTATVSALVSEIIAEPAPVVIDLVPTRPAARVIVQPVVIELVPPSPERFAAPDPVVIELRAPPPSGVRIVQPAPVVVELVAVSPATAKDRSIVPSPVVIELVIPAAGGTVAPAFPVLIDWSAPVPATMRTVRATPVVIELSVLGPEKRGLPDPAVIELVPVPAQIFRGRYHLQCRGLFRVFNAAGYRIFRSSVAPPEEGDLPWATAATLPATPADVFADGTWYVSVSYFNGVVDSGFLALGDGGETYAKIVVAGGVSSATPPERPIDWRLERRAGGVVRIVALAYAAVECQWAVAYSDDGSDPAADAPSITATLAEGLSSWEYDLPAADHGDTVKVRLQIRRNDGTPGVPVWVYSTGSTIKSITADAAGPSVPVAAERSARPTVEV